MTTITLFSLSLDSLIVAQWPLLYCSVYRLIHWLFLNDHYYTVQYMAWFVDWRISNVMKSSEIEVNKGFCCFFIQRQVRPKLSCSFHSQCLIYLFKRFFCFIISIFGVKFVDNVHVYWRRCRFTLRASLQLVQNSLPHRKSEGRQLRGRGTGGRRGWRGKHVRTHDVLAGLDEKFSRQQSAHLESLRLTAQLFHLAQFVQGRETGEPFPGRRSVPPLPPPTSPVASLHEPIFLRRRRGSSPVYERRYASRRIPAPPHGPALSHSAGRHGRASA